MSTIAITTQRIQTSPTFNYCADYTPADYSSLGADLRKEADSITTSPDYYAYLGFSSALISAVSTGLVTRYFEPAIRQNYPGINDVPKPIIFACNALILSIISNVFFAYKQMTSDRIPIAESHVFSIRVNSEVDKQLNKRISGLLNNSLLNSTVTNCRIEKEVTAASEARDEWMVPPE